MTHVQFDLGASQFLDPLSFDFWLHVAAAIFCGAIIGLERQVRGKPAGIRTCVLICLGTQFFVVLGSSFAPLTADPTRVVGQVVTGIGFLGAGVILTREGVVVGVTSAAVIWLLAAIGARRARVSGIHVERVDLRALATDREDVASPTHSS